VLGYVDADYGRRAAAEMEDEVGRYLEWYEPAGVFIDRTPASTCSSAAICKVLSAARSHGLSVTINPGQPEIDPQDAELCDHVVNFEGPQTTYRATKFPDWVEDVHAGKFWHLVYEVDCARDMREIAAAVADAHAEILYITDATMPNPWERVPSYWREEQALLLDS
jgi:hypothetical protein